MRAHAGFAKRAAGVLTLTGLLFLPVCLVAFASGLRARLAVLSMGAVLSSAAVVNLGSFGVPPGYFMGLLILGHASVLTLARGGQHLDREVLLRVVPVGILIIASLNALFWANAVFWDHVWVVSGRQMFDLATAERYSFRPENINQLTYLMLNAGLAIVLADQLGRVPPQALLRMAHFALRAAFALATLFVAWDYLANRFGFYFPETFLHSNAFYAAAHNQSFGEVHRVSGSFAEPSALAYGYGGFLAYASGCYLSDRRASSLLLVLVALAALSVSTSTTAYALIGIWAAGMAVAVPLSWWLPGKRPVRMRSRFAVIMLAALAVAGVLAAARAHQEEIRVIYEESIRGKTETGSFQSRTGADYLGLETFGTTWGMGLGLGSHQPGTLPVTLLSNVGVAGTLAFVVFVWLCLYRPRRHGPWPWAPRELWPFRAFTIGLFAGHCISNPVLNTQLLWLSLTLNLAITAYRLRNSTTDPGRARAAGTLPLLSHSQPVSTS